MNYKTKARITLFNYRKTGKPNEPDFKGILETPEGKLTVTLWKESNDKVTGGFLYKGQVAEKMEDIQEDEIYQ